MTKRTPKQLSDARRIGIATVLIFASAITLLTIGLSSRAKASEPSKQEPPKPMVFGMVISCTPIPEDRDYLCRIRMVHENLNKDNIPPAPPKQSKTPPVIKGKVSI